LALIENRAAAGVARDEVFDDIAVARHVAMIGVVCGAAEEVNDLSAGIDTSDAFPRYGPKLEDENIDITAVNGFARTGAGRIAVQIPSRVV